MKPTEHVNDIRPKQDNLIYLGQRINDQRK